MSPTTGSHCGFPGTRRRGRTSRHWRDTEKSPRSPEAFLPSGYTPPMGVVVMSRRLWLVAPFALVLALSLVGCKPTESPGASGTTGPSAAEPETAVEADLSYLTGAWSVTTTLTDIDNSAMTMAADQPGAQWSCEVDGTTMKLLTDQHEYTGTLKAQGANGWTYGAEATFIDESGYTWTSSIKVRATQDGDDSFTCTG